MTTQFRTNTTQLPQQIDRISAEAITPQGFFETYQKPGVPVIISGLLDTPDWNLDFLCSQLDQREFVVRCYGGDRYQQDKRQWTDIGSGVTLRNMTFNDYADSLRSREAHQQDMYLAKCPIKDTPLGSTPAFRALSGRLGLRFPATNLNIWVGPSGHTECLHYDPVDGTLMQLHGEKKLILFPPDQLENLYPFPLHAHLRHGLKLRSWFSQVYPDRPDFEAFPKLRDALQHRYEVILQSGEVLFIPVGWWHEVIALGDEMVCSVNQFWHVYPIDRALLSWSKWRAHLGSLLAIPYSLWETVSANTPLRHRL